MGSSPTDESVAPKDGGETQEKMVPISAVAEERAQKRAARDEAKAATEELAKIKNAPNIPDDLIAQLAAEARKAVEAELAPLKERAHRAEVGVRFGLNEAQVNKVWEIKTKHPTLSDDMALSLAKTEFADAFKTSSSWNRAVHGGLPVTGTSDARTAPMADDHLALMREAESKKDYAKAQYHAQEEALDRFRKLFNSRPIR